MAKTKKDKHDYMCVYVCGNGRTQCISNSLSFHNIGEAMAHCTKFFSGMCKKNGEDFNADTIVSFTIMRKPSRGRIPKKVEE